MSALNRLFNFIAVVMFTLEVFSAGAKFADNSVADGTIALVLAAFWGGVLLIEWSTLRLRAKRLEKADRFIDELFHWIESALKDMEATKATAPKRKPARKPAAKKPVTKKKGSK